MQPRPPEIHDNAEGARCDRRGEAESRGTDQPSGTVGRPDFPARRRQRGTADDNDPDAERPAQSPRPRAPALIGYRTVNTASTGSWSDGVTPFASAVA